MSKQPLSTSVRFAGFDCIDPGSEPMLARARQEPTRANSFWNPLGPAWGRGYLVMFAKDVRTLLEGGNGALPYGLEMSDGETKIKIPKLWVNKAERLTPGAADSKSAAYLVEIVDKRYFAAHFSDTGVLRSRVRSGAHNFQDDEFIEDNPMGLPFLYNENPLGPVDDNLESQITLLWAPMATLLGTMPELPEWFLGSDTLISHRRVLENIKFDAHSAWSALHVILERMGASLRYDPIRDVFEWVDLTTAQDVQQGEMDKRGWTLSIHPLNNDATIFPEKLRVYFPKHFSNFGQENDTGRGDGTDAQRNWVMHPYYTEDVLTATVASAPHTTIPGTVVPIMASVPAVYDYNNGLFNLDSPSTDAVSQARLWVRAREQGATRGAIQVIGLLDKAVTGSLVKSIRWSGYGSAHGGMVTELVNQIGLPSAPGEQPKEELYAPLDIHRGTFPNYPRVSQLVRIFHYAGEADTVLDPEAGTMVNSDVTGTQNGLSLHSGKVVRAAGTTWPGHFEKCWIYFEDEYPEAIHAPNGEFYHGRLMGGGSAGAEEEWRPLYFVRRGPIAPHTVQIDDQLNAGGTTTATIFGVDDVSVRDRYLASGENAPSSSTVVVAWDDTAAEFVAIAGPHAS